MPKIHALIVAAGRGSRAGVGGPKQYRLVAGRAVLAHTASAFLAHPQIDRVSIAIHGDDRAAYEAAMADLNDPKLSPPILGGASRQDSVRLGLRSMAPEAPDFVLIHDGARPLVSAQTISNIIKEINQKQGASAALPVHDTLKKEQSTYCGKEIIERDGLWRMSTPQGFPFTPILAAHDALESENFTDDSALALATGLPVKLVESNPENIKITLEKDFAMAEKLMGSASNIRTITAQGFDVHRFGPGDGVILGGVKIPHDHGLVGHSDADVALHALTDALLGSISAGDIGDHFPPSDPQWQGADSAQFLRHACTLLSAQGGTLTHLDLTLICEAPKISPHRADMQQRIAAIAGLTPDQVSIKATTSEGLGFTGRGEGIAAMALATVTLPAKRG